MLRVITPLLFMFTFLSVVSDAFVAPRLPSPSATTVTPKALVAASSPSTAIIGTTTTTTHNNYIDQYHRRRRPISPTTRTTQLFATSTNLTPAQESRRRELLGRQGPYFQMNRFQGAVEFGSSTKLTTQLVDTQPNPQGIAEWLSDGKGLALSIWEEGMMTDLGNSLYRLQTMKLQFVTIQLAPSVDVQMWTSLDNGEPVFSLQSVDFDPNIQVLPGVGIKASTLGIQIDVVGELRPTQDGRGVEGSISFATQGNLPPPLRVLPEGPLRLASQTINETIVSFAVQSFQKGAIRKYQEYLAERQQRNEETMAAAAAQQEETA